MRLRLCQCAPTAKNELRHFSCSRRIGKRVDSLRNFTLPTGLVFLTPLRDHYRRHFKMELQAIYAIPKSKCLITAGGGGRKQLGALRQVESFSVPVEDHFGVMAVKERIVLRACIERYRFPPNFFLPVRVDL